MGEVLAQRAIIVGVGLKPTPLAEVKISLGELEELTHAAGAEIVGACWQVLDKWNPATLIGSGKIQEIKELIEKTSANLVIIDHKLSGIQTRNLEEILKVGVLDRNQVILDIFAQRAQTYEGKLQVELAQSLDQMPRMVGAWLGSLSRLGGGIGTRGPGEKAIETDRRTVRHRIDLIRKKLEVVRKNRSQHRAARKKNQIPSFALIGYTNSGKSTLLNAMTHGNVLTKDQVFATLDPTTRKIHLGTGRKAVLTDTVGFIRKLPPQLVDAFKATLEESSEADVLLHVIDLSSPFLDRQIESVSDLIKEFGWDKKPIIHVFNKIDVASPEQQFKVNLFPRIFISAKTGEGLDKLKDKMVEELNSLYEEKELFFPKAEEYKIFELGKEATIIKQEAASQGTICSAHLTPESIRRWRKYLVSSSENQESE